ncbi:MAG TPA: hypothetical protein VK705_10660 [Ferruginibacter sp.]|jgi:hypothetical protein|nr:hypothetical protein [Ferruginibacter sp.]
MANILTEAEAHEVLQPHLKTLEKIMVESLEDLNQALGTLTETPNKRAKSTLLHSIAIEKSKKYFADSREVYIKEKYQSIQIVFSNQIVARIKKVNHNNISANARTKRNQSILDHQMTLFGNLINVHNTPSTFVDLGYNLDETGGSYNKLNVICRKDKDVEWVFSFKENVTTIAIGNKQEDALSINEETQIKIKKAK